MNHQKTLFALAFLASAATTGAAQASLFDRGNGLIYNNATNTTWAKDANLFQTQAAGNANLVADIIAANNGVIYDKSNIVYNGIHTLTNADFTTVSGAMDWWGAQAWIGYLNKTSYDGYNNWSLPTTAPATLLGSVGFNKTGSQMGELFYNELGGVAKSSISTIHNANYNLFTHVQSSLYWSASEFGAYSAWVFTTNGGGQAVDLKSAQLFSWAVRPGDVAAVPVPGAAWLFGSSLIGLVGFRRKAA